VVLIRPCGFEPHPRHNERSARGGSTLLSRLDRFAIYYVTLIMDIKKFPYLEVRGSYRDIGSAIGETFRDRIGYIINLRKNRIPGYSELLSQTYDYFQITLKTFPQYVDEMTAIATAARVGVADYFFANTEELYLSEYVRDRMEHSHDRCTIAVSFTDNGSTIGHNEDWLPENIDNFYILKATIGSVKFLSLSEVNVLPGACASFNNFGLVQCINDLAQISKVGIPKNFLSRAILECQSLQEAETLLLQSKRASGYNHVLVQGNEVHNIEISGDDHDIQVITQQPYVHTNHFLSRHMVQYETERSESSVARYDRAKELIRNDMTVEDMKTLLRDTKNTEFPICRSDSTIASVIISPNKNEMLVCYGRPCAGEYVSYKLS
jgi:hypothetical protein